MVRVKKTDETEDEDTEMTEEDIEALSHGNTIAWCIHTIVLYG